MAKDGAEEEERYQQRLERKKQAVGTKGMFYADQFSTDKKPMGRFGMGKSGVMWPVPEVVERGYSGELKRIDSVWIIYKQNCKKVLEKILLLMFWACGSAPVYSHVSACCVSVYCCSYSVC